MKNPSYPNLLVFLTALLVLARPRSGWAQFNFITNADNTITITGYTGPGGNVIIPGMTNGYRVTAIGTKAFEFNSTVTGVTIPNSVTSIGLEAFDGCSGLTSVTIPDSVTDIGDYAFWYCSGLTNVSIADSVTRIGDDSFELCVGLTNVTIPDSVTSIGDWAFGSCFGLTSVTIPNSVTRIGDWAFVGCSDLMRITIGNSVTNIGAYAFENCSVLTRVTIPNSLTSIGAYAFYNCTNLHLAYFQGNAPSVLSWPVGTDSTVFQGETGTVYFVPGTTGWTDQFGGWPTAPWYQPRPQILGSDYGLGVGSNGFQFTISWATNAAVVVEASTNLQTWTPVGTNTLVNGTSLFWDSDWTHYPQRFYMLQSQ